MRYKVIEPTEFNGKWLVIEIATDKVFASCNGLNIANFVRESVEMNPEIFDL